MPEKFRRAARERFTWREVELGSLMASHSCTQRACVCPVSETLGALAERTPVASPLLNFKPSICSV